MLRPMTEPRSPAAYADDIAGARQRLLAFVGTCTDEDWSAAPLDGDPRPVGVVVDHVAHAYEYLAGWTGDLLAGRTVAVSPEVVDALNAGHAPSAAGVTRPKAADHLRRSGDVLIALVAGLDPGQLEASGGRVRRFAEIAARHADDHRSDLEAALRRAR
jgi:hypothetical protein